MSSSVAPPGIVRARAPAISGIVAASGEDRIAIIVPQEGAGSRLDRFLAGQAESRGWPLSRTRLKALILDSRVTIDGQAARDPARLLTPGREIEIELPRVKSATPAGEPMPLAAVYEDDDLIVIDKPAGLVVHPAAGHASGTLVNALIAHCGASLSGIGGVARPGIVHRLDKDTTGLMVVAKTDAAHKGLARSFADHGRTGSLVRVYRAIVWGVPERRNGTIDAPLARNVHHRRKIAVVREGSGRRAVTHWQVEERFGALASLLSCHLETGRTHQIRVHMAHAGHPLLGDPTYGGAFKTKAALLPKPAQDALRQLGRQALHAAVLGFEHPIAGELLEFRSPLPQDLEHLVQSLRVG